MMDKTVQNDTDNNFKTYLRTDNLTSEQTLCGYNNWTPIGKKENEKIPRLTFLKISFADTHLAHLLLLGIIFPFGRTKLKEPNFPNAQLKNSGTVFIFIAKI